MNNLKLKVCGMRDPENISGLLDLRPDFIGFIFYPKSPRYVDEMDGDFVMRIPLSIHKVGVFVNESLENIVTLADKYGLEYIQLHGDEDLDFAKAIREKGLKVIKVFRVMDTIPFVAKQYEGIADYFLFDTQSMNYGGSGRHFDWNILRTYNINVPFLLSGGVQLEDIDQIKEMNIEKLVGVDVNSRFEVEPALKDIEKLKLLKEAL
ncbi:phosphoribosylanthranilate isomerase [Ekhidna lutea]|uniref:N-(5'-phosphoribosyl)anthranilate isomerase n=1 Tax=Ekhidna lutea TaxID=447679 RepID=A0A239M3H6_EKHLU|nr:phosphoribosylanthranilate isomerase [Ekhidna lutea]SNT36479.1 phosphoribosylanthranilate isomerase [Ekhidna lutea]